jgi:hypothetical protein
MVSMLLIVPGFGIPGLVCVLDMSARRARDVRDIFEVATPVIS